MWRKNKTIKTMWSSRFFFHFQAVNFPLHNAVRLYHCLAVRFLFSRGILLLFSFENRLWKIFFGKVLKKIHFLATKFKRKVMHTYYLTDLPVIRFKI